MAKRFTFPYPLTPRNLVVNEEIVVINNRAVHQLQLSWDYLQGVNNYKLGYKFIKESLPHPDKLPDASYTFVDVNGTTYNINGLGRGYINIFIYGVNKDNLFSINPLRTQIHTLGKVAPPENISGFKVEPQGFEFAKLSWTKATEADVLNGGYVEIRFTTLTSNATWEGSIEVAKLAGISTEAVLNTERPGTFSAKFVDDGGRKSTTEALGVLSQAVTPYSMRDLGTVQEETSAGGWKGITHCYLTANSSSNMNWVNVKQVATSAVNTSSDLITMTAHGYADNRAILYSSESGTAITGLNTNQTYYVKYESADTFKLRTEADGSVINLTGQGNNNQTFSDRAQGITLVDPTTKTGTYCFYTGWFVGYIGGNSTPYTYTIERMLEWEPFYSVTDFASRGNVEDMESFTGEKAPNVNVRFYYKTTLGTTSGVDNNTWSDWVEFTKTSIRCTGFTYKAVVETTDPNQNVKITKLGVSFTLPYRHLAPRQTATYTANAASMDVTYAIPFWHDNTADDPNLQVTGVDLAAGEYIVLSGFEKDGFTIAIKQSDGNPVSADRKFFFAASGYGYRA
jgi:hypothetical protein